MSIKKIDFNEISKNPIDNFYNKLKIDISDFINEYFRNYTNNHKSVYENFSNCQTKINNNINDLKKYKKDNNITLKYFENVIIFILFFLLIGFLFFKIFKNNKQSINKYKEYKNKINESNIELNNQKVINTKIYFYDFNFTNLFKQFANVIGFGIRNNLSNNEYNSIKNYFPILQINRSLIFLYKNNPIIDLYYKQLIIRNISYHQSKTYSYLDTVYHDGKYETVTKYETLTATHIEPTPFIENFNNLIMLTNFNKDCNFTINNKKYLKFENKEFSKAFRISNFENKMDSSLLEFFTIKAQEDYLNWYNKNDKKIDNEFSKINNIINISNVNKPYINLHDNDTSFQWIDFNKNIDDNLENLRNIFQSYYLSLINSMQYPLISPIINREGYSVSDNDFHISNNFDFSQIDNNNDYCFEYIIAKLYKPNSLFFVNQKPKRPSWIDNILVKNRDGYYELNCELKSYDSKKMFDPVVVSGNSGVHTINVPYDFFYPIRENKVIYFFPIKNIQIPNFSISWLLDYQICSHDEKFNNSWLKDFPIWSENIDFFKNLKNQKVINAFINLSKNLSPNLTISKIDEGIAIISNNILQDEDNISIIKDIINDINGAEVC